MNNNEMKMMEYVQRAWEVQLSPNYEDIFRLLDNANLNGSVENAMKSARDYYDRHEQEKKLLFFDKMTTYFQTYNDKRMRMNVYKKLREVIEPYIKCGDNLGFLAIGGSTLSRLATHGADLDLCISLRCTDGEYDEDRDTTQHILARIWHVLKNKPLIRDIYLVQARVPILQIKLSFPYHAIRVEINCNCVAGIYNSHLLYYYAKLDERFMQMNIILKEWAKSKNVVAPRHGRLNSYTVSLMIIHFLQCGVFPPVLPNLYALFPQHFGGTMDLDLLDYDLQLEIPDIPKNKRTTMELVYGFFEYYSRFDYDNWAISIKEARIYDRSGQPEEDKKYLFFLEEAYDGMTVPKNLTQDWKLIEIVQHFQFARKPLLSDLFGGISVPDLDTSKDYWRNVELRGNGRDENGWTRI